MEHRLFVPGVCVKTVITEDRTSCGSIKEYCSIYRHTNLGREALKSKNALFPWYTIVEVGEAYTSKTCEECGTLHQKLGGNKVLNALSAITLPTETYTRPRTSCCVTLPGRNYSLRARTESWLRDLAPLSIAQVGCMPREVRG